MAILELPQLKFLAYSRIRNGGTGGHEISLFQKEELTYFQMGLNFTNGSTLQSNLNITFNSEEDVIYYHKNYLWLLLIIMISFFGLSYYLYYVSKYNIKKAKINNTETNITFLKYTNYQNLSIATFRNFF
jgi:hypothetical protein